MISLRLPYPRREKKKNRKKGNAVPVIRVVFGWRIQDAAVSRGNLDSFQPSWCSVSDYLGLSSALSHAFSMLSLHCLGDVSPYRAWCGSQMCSTLWHGHVPAINNCTVVTVLEAR
jgi:hypothetical protein